VIEPRGQSMTDLPATKRRSPRGDG
jgi:hypothetical protein